MNVFEERVVCFEAENWGAAHRKAKAESEQYASDNRCDVFPGFDVFPERDGYEQDGDALIDGYEVWSILLESHESLAEFYAARYRRYDYHP